jgi:hypothetical protein
MKELSTIFILVLTINLSFSQCKKSNPSIPFDKKVVAHFTNIGNSLPGMFRTELVKTIKFEVIRRCQLEKLLQRFAPISSVVVSQSSIFNSGKMMSIILAIKIPLGLLDLVQEFFERQAKSLSHIIINIYNNLDENVKDTLIYTFFGFVIALILFLIKKSVTAFLERNK